jgi:hypothetical protein
MCCHVYRIDVSGVSVWVQNNLEYVSYLFSKQTQTSWDAVKEIVTRTNSLRETVRLQRVLRLVGDEATFTTYIKQQPSCVSGWHEYQYTVAGQSWVVATNFGVADVHEGTQRAFDVTFGGMHT